MFPDAFLPNLIVFLAGQVAACGYLRTGLVNRGVHLLVLTWISADVALVARFGYAHTGTVYVLALVVMQIVSIVGIAMFAAGRIRRRRPKLKEQREGMFREAFVAYLKNDLEPAEKLYQKLVRLDPWDASTRLGLATVLSRSGQAAKSRKWLRSVRGLDSDQRFRDAVERELESARPPEES